MTREQVFFVVLLWAVPFALAVWIGTRSGRRGWVYGLFLGWLGVFILTYLGDAPVGSHHGLESFTQCRHCGLLIPAGSKICRHCHRQVMSLTQ
jgi:hypothetical protein